MLSSWPNFQSTLLIGTVLQLIMVVAGHFMAEIAELFGPIGVLISLLAGALLTLRAPRRPIGTSLLGGALVGGISALIGIIVSWALADVAALILLVGTISSAITGALGGFLGRLGTARD